MLGSAAGELNDETCGTEEEERDVEETARPVDLALNDEVPDSLLEVELLTPADCEGALDMESIETDDNSELSLSVVPTPSLRTLDGSWQHAFPFPSSQQNSPCAASPHWKRSTFAESSTTDCEISASYPSARSTRLCISLKEGRTYSRCRNSDTSSHNPCQDMNRARIS
jgi:hypothetical protein